MTMVGRGSFNASIALDPQAPFGDRFRHLDSRPLWHDREATRHLCVDVTVNGTIFHIEADMPVVDKKQIKVGPAAPPLRSGRRRSV